MDESQRHIIKRFQKAVRFDFGQKIVSEKHPPDRARSSESNENDDEKKEVVIP